MSDPFDGMDDDAWADLMAEDALGENFGGSASRLVYRDRPYADGQVAPLERRSLNTDTRAARQFVAISSDAVEVVGTSNLHWHGGVSDLLRTDSHRTLTRVELEELDQAQVRASALDRLGFTEADMAVLDRSGRAPGDIQDRFEERLLQVSEDGGRMTDLARALGWTVYSSGRCNRMMKALGRARKRRKACLLA